MFKEIQHAESAIKAGDTKTGFEVLRVYIAENPDSERAWWIMSGLVEQVLRINPNNRLAQETLDKLLASPPEPETKPQRDLPSHPFNEIELGYPVQAFLYKKRSRIYLTLLDGIQIIRAYTAQADLSVVRDAVQKGELPYQYLSEIKAISQDSIRSVKHSGSTLIIQ